MCAKCTEPPEGWGPFGVAYRASSPDRKIEFSTELCEDDLLPCWQHEVVR